MGGKASRDKGKRGERLIVERFKAVLPALAHQLRRSANQSRAGSDAPDLVGAPGLWTEVKFGKKPNLRAAHAQAVEAKAANQSEAIAVAVCKDDGKEPLVVLELKDFLRFYVSWLDACSNNSAS